MIETFLSVIPSYGLWIVLLSVVLSCIALPVPSSMVVIAAGGFAAAGEFSFWQLVVFASAGCLLGDQITFWVARRAGVPLISHLASRSKTTIVLERARVLVEHRGAIAIFLSRTVLSPLGPYTNCVAGTLGMSWLNFTLPASTGAFLWSVGYTTLGFTMAGQIGQIASVVGE